MCGKSRTRGAPTADYLTIAHSLRGTTLPQGDNTLTLETAEALRILRLAETYSGTERSTAYTNSVTRAASEVDANGKVEPTGGSFPND